MKNGRQWMRLAVTVNRRPVYVGVQIQNTRPNLSPIMLDPRFDARRSRSSSLQSFLIYHTLFFSRIENERTSHNYSCTLSIAALLIQDPPTYNLQSRCNHPALRSLHIPPSQTQHPKSQQAPLPVRIQIAPLPQSSHPLPLPNVSICVALRLHTHCLVLDPCHTHAVRGGCSAQPA